MADKTHSEPGTPGVLSRLAGIAVVAVVLAAMVGCSVLAVKFSSICCILFCGATGVLTYAVGQGKKGGTK